MSRPRIGVAQPGDVRAVLRLVLKEMHQSTLRVLEGTTLADVAAKVREAAAGTKPVVRYSI